MVTKEDIEKVVNNTLKYILLVAESSLPASQFVAYRKLVLDSCGERGLVRDLERLIIEKERQGTGGNILCKRRGAV